MVTLPMVLLEFYPNEQGGRKFQC